MPDIFHDVMITAPGERVYDLVSTPAGLDKWWTKRCSGTRAPGMRYELSFGPDITWSAAVVRCVSNEEFQLEMRHADGDWTGTRISFELARSPRGTVLRFQHTGWPELNEHYRVSCHCWALYLRILRRHLEHAEFVPYEDRLDV